MVKFTTPSEQYGQSQVKYLRILNVRLNILRTIGVIGLNSHSKNEVTNVEVCNASETYAEPCKICKMEHFMKTVNGFQSESYHEICF